MKKYITKEELPSILQDLAEQTLALADTMTTHFRIIQNSLDKDERLLEVVVSDLKGNPLAYRTYIIIDKVYDCYDVIKDTIEEGQYKLNEDYQ